jgi:putative DNA primase/helicase
MSRLVASRRKPRFGRASATSPMARWPEPQPVPRGRPPVPAFEEALLPEALRAWVADVANRVQCPPDFVAVGAIVSAAAVIGRKVAIRPKRQDDWAVVPLTSGDWRWARRGS